ncbi:peptidase G2 autoproteolytic cleavage domain-containing protein [Bacillus glycinifermentans]|uniref:peptidase G2 autoproteolytic cleavage domain-containing protein n=1 Tax=Bacillus glycinifermentans TaxID=1664069 RepID=UPI002DBF5654|nr:peptidase G2 autoproteolytic cleavage domain-containing protein [Bacillus glycinifermentans]MEC0495050.1 peptidase G2 autoproteolytic cleavage domain-containing protein [Bacillus glycinifermentans]MEC0540807.1 peptidase G2 autoproteolytic cleavage domain-containing protein [Bacillus glycinifermentans]
MVQFRKPFDVSLHAGWRSHFREDSITLTEMEQLKARMQNLIQHAGASQSVEVTDARVTAEGEITSLLKERLDKEYHKLLGKITREVNVEDFGAVPDGRDNTEAFQKAIGTGCVKVNVPAGVYLVQGIKLPSWTYFVGQGKGVTVIKLHENAPAYEWVITNDDYENGNRNIFVQGMTLDWNPDRQGGVRNPGGQYSSCLTFAKVEFGWIKDIEAVNAGLHGIDITSPTYDHLPDTDWTKDGSKYIWVDHCVAYGAGDDGITTHYSEYVFISNCHSANPRGTEHGEGMSNSNGIEIDDGSKHVWLLNNITSGNIRGVEVKAHEMWPASQNVHIIGHISYRDVRAFDLRHIGHHQASDPESTTAYDVTLTDCTAVEPVFNPLYDGVTPRALVVSAYKNVYVNGFTAIGDPEYDYGGNPVVALQYRSQNITINGIKIRGFKKAGVDINLSGGANKTDYVKISNFDIYHSAPKGISIGGGLYNVNMMNGTMIADSGTVGIQSPNSQAVIIGVQAVGYDAAASIKGQTYEQVPLSLKGGAQIATTSGFAFEESSAVIAGTGDITAKGERNAVIGSSGGSSTEGSRAFIAASNNSHIKGNSVSRTILSSESITLEEPYTVAGGYQTINWLLDSLHGNGIFAGSVRSSLPGGYGEYFESENGQQIDTGIIVALRGEKIAPAQESDDMLGVVSETAAFVSGESSFTWQSRFLTNEFGGLVYEEKMDEETGELIRVPKQNPNFQEVLEESYLSRAARDEWHVVGLLSRHYVRIDGTVRQGDYVKALNGIGTRASEGSWKVMKITAPYNPENEYGIALVMIK